WARTASGAQQTPKRMHAEIVFLIKLLTSGLSDGLGSRAVVLRHNECAIRITGGIPRVKYVVVRYEIYRCTLPNMSCYVTFRLITSRLSVAIHKQGTEL